MLSSLNCLVLGQTSNDVITKCIGENSVIDELQGLNTMNIWKVKLDYKSLKDKIYTEDEIKNLGTKMEPMYELKEYLMMMIKNLSQNAFISS
ncbi:hypothetical protein GLOIN_2v1808787 [Rhizophagus irregularis DAOM 181602=DAOM 197198]|nr:hypothetical protein GLOIN_2v1808787 [Rhizophagus irregularis DAOM 181602=DAOM 197198]